MRGRSGAAFLASIALAACSAQDWNFGDDAALPECMGVECNGAVADADSNADAAAEAGNDAADATVDVAVEAGPDVTVDAGPDVGPDVGVDVGPDVGPDVGADVGADVGRDGPVDGPVDVGADVFDGAATCDAGGGCILPLVCDPPSNRCGMCSTAVTEACGRQMSCNPATLTCGPETEDE